jgi:hypothetical protein
MEFPHSRGSLGIHMIVACRRTKVRYSSDVDVTSDDSKNGNSAVSGRDELSADKTKLLRQQQYLHQRLEERWRARYVYFN